MPPLRLMDGRKPEDPFAQKALYWYFPVLPDGCVHALPARGRAAGRHGSFIGIRIPSVSEAQASCLTTPNIAAATPGV